VLFRSGSRPPWCSRSRSADAATGRRRGTPRSRHTDRRSGSPTAPARAAPAPGPPRAPARAPCKDRPERSRAPRCPWRAAAPPRCGQRTGRARSCGAPSNRRSRAGSCLRRTGRSARAGWRGPRAPRPGAAPETAASQGHAVLPEGDLPEPVDLATGPGAPARHLQHELEQALAELGELGGPGGDGTRVEVDPAGLLVRERRVGADLEGGAWKAHGRAPPGGEQDDVRAGGDERRRGDPVVARRIDERDPAEPRGRWITVLQHLGHRRLAALLHTTERLFGQGRDAARLVARRRVLVDGLSVAPKVVAEGVDHLN